jgi:uncharacterized protein (TIGR02246 family)
MAPSHEQSFSAEDTAVRGLFRDLHRAWNAKDARAVADLFTPDGWALGFDGSLHADPHQLASDLAGIFASHQTAAYVARVRSVRFLSPDAAILLAATGLVPPGARDINPAVNAFQVIVACRRGGAWKIASLQNTPAAFQGRPALAEAMSDELRAALREGQSQDRGGEGALS